ncbi:MAG: NmrA family NAD(P)-binding protein [Methylovulum miyakonense]|uniref:NmrA family NAD(P)-binding protein n=1 Tax=Methylovulum miyakonense TaxID=645578 RepID=UPI003BB5C933
MKEKILITSATGKTGFETTKQLLKDGYPTRILVRSRNAKALELEKLGAEISIGNLTNANELNSALKNITRVYYCHPFVPHLLQNTKLFIQCAKENNIEAIVNMGQWLAEFDDQRSVHTNDIKASYIEYEQSGLNVIQFIPGFFADNTFFVTEFAIQLGLMPLPFGKGKNPPISNEDLGLVIASLLKNPQPYIGQRLRPTGPKSLSSQEMASIFSKVVGRKVRYIYIPEWMFLKAAFMFAKDFGLDEFAISQIRHYMKEYQANKFDIGGATNIVKAVTGKDPDDFETIVKNYVNNSPYKKRNLFNWFLAMKKFMILPLQPVPNVKALEKYNQ